MHHETRLGYGSRYVVTVALPKAGGIMDQDNKTMDAFDLLKTECNKIYAEKEASIGK